MRHGLLSRCIVIENESQELFDLLLDQHMEFFQPRNDIERNAVEDIVAAYWRSRRAMAIETEMFSTSVRKQSQDDELARLQRAFAYLAETPKFNVLSRYETKLRHAYQSAIRNFERLRERRTKGK